MREPKAFLFDEPLSNLDAALRVQMRLEIGELHQTLKTTMIYVTHDQVEAMTMADKIVVLDRGAVAQVGSPLELYNRPNGLFVARFIGSPTMNFVDGPSARQARRGDDRHPARACRRCPTRRANGRRGCGSPNIWARTPTSMPRRDGVGPMTIRRLAKRRMRPATASS